MAGLLRALRLVEKGRAPAAFIRRRGISAPPGRFMRRSVTNSAVPLAGPCASCEKQILDLRKEIMADNQRVWKMYDDLLEVNRSMVKKMGEIEAKAAERQLAAVETMVKTSYTILASGGAFMFRDVRGDVSASQGGLAAGNNRGYGEEGTPAEGRHRDRGHECPEREGGEGSERTSVCQGRRGYYSSRRRFCSY